MTETPEQSAILSLLDRLEALEAIIAAQGAIAMPQPASILIARITFSGRNILASGTLDIRKAPNDELIVWLNEGRDSLSNLQATHQLPAFCHSSDRTTVEYIKAWLQSAGCAADRVEMRPDHPEFRPGSAA